MTLPALSSSTSTSKYETNTFKSHRRPSIPNLKLSVALCLILAVDPSKLSPLSPTSNHSTLVSAAPVLPASAAAVPTPPPSAHWTPVTSSQSPSSHSPHSSQSPYTSSSSSFDQISNSQNPFVVSPIFKSVQGQKQQPLSIKANSKADEDAGRGNDELISDSGSGSGSDSESNGISLVATANDFGVVQLDLEGDPNCDYTTKVKIAGQEFNLIIDTGSSHFAIASSLCPDCVIPLKDHFIPGQEEEIPIDDDDTKVVDTSIDKVVVDDDGASNQTDDDIIFLLKKHSKNTLVPVNKVHGETTPTPTASTPTEPTSKMATTTTTATIIASTTTTTISNAASPSKQQSAVSTQLPSSSSSKSRDTIRLTATINSPKPTPDTTSFGNNDNNQARMRFPSLKNRLNEMFSSLLALPTATISVSISGSDDSTTNDPHLSQSINHSNNNNINNNNSKNDIPAIIPLLKHNTKSLDQAAERILAVAPAENLYPFSESSSNRGETVQVTYGIKSHSVGWSGVMTSDLMTLEMSKVDPKYIAAASAASQQPGELPGTTNQLLEAGGTMEKETNVEFAAITENNQFFSQECGAQHGIWGLGYRALSGDRKPTLFDKLSASMKIPNGFALQLCGRTSNVTKSGNMFLGGYSSAHVAEPMQYVPIVKRDWYQVKLDGFKVMGQPVQGMRNLNIPKTIVDSGTTNILMSHYNLQFLIQSLAQSQVITWSSLIPEQDIYNFWFQNAVLRLPRSSFQISTAARALEAVISGVPIPIYTSSIFRIKAVPEGQAPEDYVDIWWHGFASSTSPDAIEAENASGGAVMPGSVGTILGETIFSGKVVYFERGNEEANPGDADYGRIGFARGKNCFGPADHSSVDILASEGKVAVIDELIGPVRVAATSQASSAIKKSSSSSSSSSLPATGKNKAAALTPVHAVGMQDGPKEKEQNTAKGSSSQPPSSKSSQPHFNGFGPIRLMGSASHSMKESGLLYKVLLGLLLAMLCTVV